MPKGKGTYGKRRGRPRKKKRKAKMIDFENKSEWLKHIADNSKATLEYLREKEDDLTKEEWALADLCGGYVHIYNLAEEFRLFDKSLLPRNTSIH